MVKNPAANAGGVKRRGFDPWVGEFSWIRSLGWGVLLEEEMVTHSSILAWRIPIDRGAWWATVHRVTEWDTIEVT